MIRAARMLPPGHDNRYELLSLAGLLVLLVGDRSSDLGGPSLGEAFVAAVKSAAPLVAESLRGVWPEDRFCYLLSALAAFRGHHRVGGLLSRAPEHVWCPVCKEELHPPEAFGRADQ